MSEKLNRFTSLMKNIFELDKSDLDFGIYRIMNIRKAEVEKFLSEGLPQKVQEALAPFASNTEEIEKRIAEIEKICSDVGVEVANSKMSEEYTSLKSQLAGGVDMSALETDVYSALYSFFNRYYDEGDFISKRRYKEGVYAIPYEGEEVKLYWANQDQYYIKTAENFKDYTFKDGERTVHFRLVDATTEHDNNKESDDSKRTFMLWEENEEYPDIKTIEVNGNEMIIRFVFDIPEDKKKKYAEENYKKVSAAIVSNYKQWFDLLRPIATSNPKKTKTLLEKHLEAYVAKNTYDYFIHKDLKGFLMRELDFYIKSEIIHLDDIDTINEKRVGTYLAKVKAIKRVGKIIIDFLAQIENFQKKLWLKKKFVVSTDWCITLDKIDESFYPEIISNVEQVKEWIDLYAIDRIVENLTTVAFSNPPTIEFLYQNKNLIVDTRYFTKDFKERLLATIDRLDEQTDALLIRSENFQALNLLQCKYKGQIDNVHIDPPYNTDTSGFLYKNNYRHSSWASMMRDRIELAYNLLDEEYGGFQCHIDENEYELLFNIFNLFGRASAGTIVWNKLNPMLGRKGVATQHEYIIYRTNFDKSIYAKSDTIEVLKEYAATAIKENGGAVNSQSRKQFAKLVSQNKMLSGGDKAYHHLDDDGTIYRLVAMGAPEKRTDPKYFIPLIHPLTKKPCPVPPNGWSRKPETMQNLINDGTIVFGTDENTQPQKKVTLSLDSTRQIASVLSEGKSGKADLDKLGLNFPYAHPVSMYETLISVNDSRRVIDFFAGSGTTGHAVINLNRTMNKRDKKYILVEMGEYFLTVTIPRIKKVVYSDDWKDGTPLNRVSGVSHILKYHVLESYEDALSNIALSEEKHQMARLFGDDYLINYMLDIEAEGSILNLDLFKTPFDYKMKINENNETKDKTVDLVETFNYLLGLAVVRQSVIAYFKSELDDKASYEGAVHLVKDIDGEYAFKQIEGTLPDGRRALIIWRNITDDLIASNAALDAYFAKHRINPADREFDIIYVNGDNNLENMKAEDESWKVNMIEFEFRNRMFEEA